MNLTNIVSNVAGKLASRKLGVTAAVAAAAGTGVVELTWPMAAVAVAYVLGQAFVDAAK
tara:strand:+ start:2577 stop:2753 length:177 start_codon:yes stop_codon:yes gene_type:complete